MTDISVGYKGVDVLTHFDALFNDRTVTALVGPSGSGKSTLLALLAGYILPVRGRISFVSDDGLERPPDASLISWVPQGSNSLTARTVLDNVLLGPLAEGANLRNARDVALACLEDVGISHLANHLVSVISGGERQRMGFARALASRKPLIFADEPSASLDAANTVHLAELLAHLKNRATVIVATHDPLLEASAESVVRLRGWSPVAA